MGIILSSTGRHASEQPKGFIDFHKTINDAKNLVYVKAVNTKGKFMWWEFSNGWNMFVTYGMTGQFSPKRGKHPAYSIYFENDEIHFNDPRHFGTVKFTNDPKELKNKLTALGWDPFSGLSDKDFKYVQMSIFDSKKPLAQLLMDQNIFAGVGNYIKSEALYLAKLSPHRLGNSLCDAEIYELCHKIIEVMETSYKYQGATISTYATPYGDEGKYSSSFKVYGQKTDPLGNKVIKETLADKRTTHWVPQVQR